jgi:hypothetical protein
MSAEGVFVYHPLGPKTPLFELWREASKQRLREQPTVSPELLKRYRSHVAARLRGSASFPADLTEDGRELVQMFRAFFPAFLERIGAPPDRMDIPVTFPTLALFDARVAEAGQQRGIFVTSQVLDVIELFARTMSLCARLNGLASPVLCALEDPSQPHILLAWMPLYNHGLEGFTLRELLREPLAASVRQQLDRQIFAAVPGFSVDASRAWGRHRLAAYLAQIMLVSMERLLRADVAGGVELLGIAGDLAPCDEAMSMDARYLATVVLTFVVLHEHAHIAHRHNSLEPMEEDPQIKQIVEGAMRFAKDHPDTVTVDLTESTQRFEQDADCFAIEAAPDTYRGAMLEAATLWFTALASADRGGTGWLEKSAEAKGRAYPQYAMRVWFLNGRYSTGARQGKIAQAITRTAEAIESSPSGVDVSLAKLALLFRALWAIGCAESGLRGGFWWGLRWPLSRLLRRQSYQAVPSP